MRNASVRTSAVSDDTAAIVDAGRNCWRIDRAERFLCIQDAADYFRLVRQALLEAEHSVFILGWDITGSIDLDPNAAEGPVPKRFDRLLAYVARQRPRLRCYVLIWDYGALYTLERDPFSRWRFGWRMPRNVHFGFDDHHPLGACHHQKVVVVDDVLAFCGGIDLTGHRWDTSAHNVEEPKRLTPTGKAYGPYHEIQALVTGRAAASLGELARERWRALGRERMPRTRDDRGRDLWPKQVAPDLTNVDVAISRTVPGIDGRPPIRECEALFLDSIAHATRTIYVESQYFTNDVLGRALATRLREADGPEVVVVAPKECQGWLEKNTMGTYRDRVFRELVAADRHGRLRLVYPCASRSRDVPTFIHSKVMVVDDVLLRIGSANCSHRSMGVDTECDLAVEATGSAGSATASEVRPGIARIRDRLVGEHLGLDPDAVRSGVTQARSLGAFIDAREFADHTLAPIVVAAEDAALATPTLQAAADPDEPIAIGPVIEVVIPPIDATSGRSPLRIWLLPAVALLTASALAWRSVTAAAIPVDAPVWVGVAGFLAGGLLLVPIELLSVLAGLLFGAVHGGVVAVAGSAAAAALGYGAGRAIGPARLSRWLSRRSYRSLRQLAARRLGRVVMLHLTSVAPAGAVHLISGAMQLRFPVYLAGTVIGVLPSVVALTGLGALLGHTLRHPTLSNALVTAGVTVGLVAVAAVLRALLLLRQFAPSLSGHRERAEFG